MDTVDLNNSPDLTVEQITKQLFNNEFMSDVQFHVEGKVVFAHSWELMKRSIVFREQFRGTLGDNKLITIEDITYDAFLEFVRFIYTDECKIEDNIICEMFELARRYKVLRLETKLSTFWTYSYGTDLELLEYCCANKYDLIYNYCFDLVIFGLSDIIEEDTFLNTDSNVLEAILKSNQISSELTEVKLYYALVRWMERSCEINQTPRLARWTHFEKILRLIRFTTMTPKEFYVCVQNDPDLFTSEDRLTICHEMVLQDQCENTKWLTEPRLEYTNPYEQVTCSSSSKWVSKFTVSDNLTLHGLRFGSGDSDIEIEITGKFGITDNIDVLRFKFVQISSKVTTYTVSLGESIKLKSNCDYAIEIKYTKGQSEINCRKDNVNLIVTGQSDLVTFTEMSKALFEIFFKIT